ncbi:MAG: hypothetical protein KF818_26280 [Chelatococcus sp.]|nr:hypothetical protein [Chelatococcus sp.]
MLCWITEERAVSQDDWIAGMPARGGPEGSAESVGLNCEAERMKFGAVRNVNSLSALMIARDDHDSALSAAPKPRHHLQGFFKKIIEYQNDNEHRGMFHNHPSGDPTPSTADIRMTQDIITIAKSLGIEVHDHIIVGRNGHASLRGMALI